MKNRKKLVLMIYSVLALSLTGCSEDDTILAAEESAKELQLENESVKIKIGSEHKLALNIQQGGGEYKAFSLDESIAAVHLENDKILIEGLTNGKTVIVVSDKNGKFRKVNVWSYTTDSHISLSTKEIKLKSLLGYDCSATANILEGNGFYTITCDNEKIKTTLSKTGQINISGVSIRDEQTATVTISDWFGLSETINVTLTAQTEPFNDEELAKIKTDSKTRYIYEKVNIINGFSVNFINKIENEKQMYGWEFPYFGYNFNISYTGDKTLGKKGNGVLNGYFSGNDENGHVFGYFNDTPINVEVIKNDGTSIWAVYFFIKNGKIHYGYLCDKV